MEVSDAPTTRDGRVIRATGSWFDVQADTHPADDGPPPVVPSRVRGKFRLQDSGQTSPVVVGDRVTIRIEGDDTGLITDIHTRHNQLIRRAAGRRVGRRNVLVTNIDMAWTVQAVRMPKFNPGFIDRFLVMAARDEIPAGLIINKVDLIRPRDVEEIEAWEALYTDLGYPVIWTSAETSVGLDALRAAMQDQTNVFAGPSGVGKSSLLNTVEPGLRLRTNEVSEKTRKGKHTTTNASLFPLSFGGYVVDTPGVREYGVVDLEPADLGHYFVEFVPFLHDCRFPNCTHDHEPGCAVMAAVEAHEITEVRYQSYLNILDSLHLGDRDTGR